MSALPNWVLITGLLLISSLGIAVSGLMLAHVFSPLQLNRPRWIAIIIETVTFTVGSVLGSILIFYFFVWLNLGGGHPGPVAGLLFLTAIFQSLGCVFWTALKFPGQSNIKWKTVGLTACSLLALLVLYGFRLL